MQFFTNFFAAFTGDGAFWMWIIFLTQVVCVGLILERTFALFISRKTSQKNLAKLISDEIKTGRLDKALAKSEIVAGKNPVGTLAKVGIEGAMQLNSKEDIQIKMDEVLMEENSRIEKRIGYLAMFANVATLLGLLGTIVGLIQSFSGIASANPAEKAEILSTGISLAMNTTAYGLLVAIPALIMYAIFQSRAAQLSEDLNKSAVKIFIGLTTFNGTVKAKAKS